VILAIQNHYNGTAEGERTKIAGEHQVSRTGLQKEECIEAFVRSMIANKIAGADINFERLWWLV
jgi:hypothetical protein